MSEVKLKSVSVAGLAALLKAGNESELLDVRTQPEYASAHVPGAKLLPLDQLKAGEYLAQHREGVPLYVLCQSGGRAAKAIEQLERAGCGDCVLVEGGTAAWIAAGLPVHRGATTVLPLMRQVQIVIGATSIVGAGLALTMSRWFAVIPLFLGCGLLFAGITGTCGLALVLARMPWNRGVGANGQNGCSNCGCGE